jgi:hypothetical protein
MLSISSVAPGAAAQIDPNAEARVYFEQGNRHYEQARRLRGARRTAALEEALRAYAESIRIVTSKNAVFNAAVVLEELGRLDGAFTYFTEYVAIPGLSEDEVAEGNRRRDVLRDRIAVVAVTSDPPGAEVRVDRLDLAPIGRTPVEIALDPGEHRLFLTAPHHENAMVRVTAVRGERVEAGSPLRPDPVELTIVSPGGGRVLLDGEEVRTGVAFRVVPGSHRLRLEITGRPPHERALVVPLGSDPMTVRLQPEVPESERAVLVVRSAVPVEVLVDRQRVGRGTEVTARVGDGGHDLAVSAEGYAPYWRRIVTRADHTTEVTVTLRPEVPDGESTLGTAPIWALVGTGIAASLMIGFGIRALELEDDYTRFARMFGSTQMERAENKAARVERFNHATDFLLALSAAGAITTLVLFIVDRDVEQEPSTATIAVAPAAGGFLLGATLSLGREPL